MLWEPWPRACARDDRFWGGSEPTGVAYVYAPDRTAGRPAVYALSRWDGESLFLDDGRVELDSSIVERVIRPLVLNHKNALFAGSHGGGEHWAVIASLIETCKLVGVEPYAYLADCITRSAVSTIC